MRWFLFAVSTVCAKKKGHCINVCRSTKKVHEVLADADTEELFLGEVTVYAVEANQLSSWKADIGINDKVVQFKVPMHRNFDNFF